MVIYKLIYKKTETIINLTKQKTMKKLILSVAMLATMTVSYAQEKSEKVKFGVKAGLNLSSATVKNTLNSEINTLTAVHFGAFATIPLANKFAFQPELLYSMQGFKEYLNDNGLIYDAKLKLNYISVPLVFQYQFVDKFYAEAGPQFDVLMSAKASQVYTNTFSNTTITQNNVDVKKVYNGLVMGFNVGAGYHITNNLSANVRYHFGISQADDIDQITTKNKVLQIGLGYSF